MAIYQRFVALNKDKHHNHKLKLISDLSFTSDLQTVPLLPTEFMEAAKEYPIVFVKQGQGKADVQSVLLLGLTNGENLFVTADGTWKARYIPAFIRRYPFILAQTGQDQLTVCVDSEFPGFNETEGTPLFNEHGETDFLKNMIQFVTDFHRDAQLTNAFAAKLQALDLLDEKNLKAELNDGREFLVNGFFVINEEKLHKLDATKVHELFSTGELALIYAHLISLSNLNRLIDLKVAK